MPTQLTPEWFNDMQEENMSILADAGVAAVKGTQNQILTALRTLFVRAAGTATQTITGIKTFTSKMFSTLAPGAGNANLTLQNTDTSADSQALDATSSSVGTAAKIRNTSTGRAAQFQTEDGYSTAADRPGHDAPRHRGSW